MAEEKNEFTELKGKGFNYLTEDEKVLKALLDQRPEHPADESYLNDIDRAFKDYKEKGCPDEEIIKLSKFKSHCQSNDTPEREHKRFVQLSLENQVEAMQWLKETYGEDFRFWTDGEVSSIVSIIKMIWAGREDAIYKRFMWLQETAEENQEAIKYIADEMDCLRETLLDSITSLREHLKRVEDKIETDTYFDFDRAKANMYEKFDNISERIDEVEENLAERMTACKNMLEDLTE